MAPKKWLYFRGGASSCTFGCPNRFCDEKVGPQHCQSASNDRKMNWKWHRRTPDREKELLKWTLLGAWPGGLREALTIRPPPLLAKGSLGVLDTSVDSFLSLTPLKVSPVAPRNPQNRSWYRPLWSPFFQSLTELTNLARIIKFCTLQAPKIIPKSE